VIRTCALECEVLQKVRYINTFTFTFIGQCTNFILFDVLLHAKGLSENRIS